MNKINIILTTMAFTAVMASFTACGEETFTDPRDGQKYKTVKIGDQVWMAENLRLKKGAEIFNDKFFYKWDSALVACPSGWHLPNKSELENVAFDTNFVKIWSSTEKEDYTVMAYYKFLEGVNLEKKSQTWGVRCVQGDAPTEPHLDKLNGYKAVRIGSQIWMADNLNIESPNSICYLDDESECTKGRYYPFSEAKNICPDGWHLPSKSEAAKFINKLIKEKSLINSTQGYYEPKTEKFHDSPKAILWTSTFGYIIRNGWGDKPEIKDEGYFIKNENWKIAIRCIADTEENRGE